ncbi:long-chain fatty acid--CoA ligase [Qaidamihabitans albus]|uniref:long-chain fatty acid--CoA ligase n=1 Tax=Qaidamihabitans albus TaxID=2795733 RepID=UPI0018F22859|nr:long-chain fatty acid--CoA ligase [Qaidamihabitans albus]
MRLEGLVQHEFPLTTGYLLDRMRTVNGDSTCTSVRGDGSRTSESYRELGARADRLGHALRSLGVRETERVATYLWNCQEHLELYLAIPSYGAVLHTLNLRLSADELTYIVDHAEDRVVFVDGSLIPAVREFAHRLRSVRYWVVVGAGDGSGLPGTVLRYEELLAAAPDTPFDWPALDDRAAAALCYTSGTTGRPKGVLYSHRSTLLHALGACAADSLGTCAADRALIVVPMFHANAWGLPYASALAGADVVLPGRAVDAAAIARLIESERITLACAVPTIWHDLLRYAEEHRPDLSSLRMVACGGAAVPRSLMQELEERHNVPIIQVWGMTETSPLATIAHPPSRAQGEQRWAYRGMAGKLLPFVQARIVDERGAQLPWDGETDGELQVRGPWIAAGYFREPDGAEKFQDGWLRTGDVAAISRDGWVRITDRAKDVIKSGGEWISSVAVENELVGHPAVREAAVIAMPDERWTERPLACVVVEPEAELDGRRLTEWLRPRITKWWLPDEYAFVPAIPRTSTGKLDKKKLRALLADGGLARGERTLPPIRTPTAEEN